MTQACMILASALIAGFTLTSCISRGTSGASRKVPPSPLYTGPPAGTIPDGSVVVIRTHQVISTDHASAETMYPGSIERTVPDAFGDTVIPANSPAELIVVETSGRETFGTINLALAIRSVTVNGKRFEVTKEPGQTAAHPSGSGANRRAGAAALLGTTLGAVPAVAGAQVITHGSNVQIPPETVLTYRLNTAIRLRGFHHK